MHAPSLIDIDECVDKTHECHSNALCINTPGGYTCACTGNYQGDGFNCECKRQKLTNNSQHQSKLLSISLYSFKCNHWYYLCIDHHSICTDSCNSCMHCSLHQISHGTEVQYPVGTTLDRMYRHVSKNVFFDCLLGTTQAIMVSIIVYLYIIMFTFPVFLNTRT